MREADLNDLYYDRGFTSRFEVIRTIGKGSVGIVILVIDREFDNREVALKIFNPQSRFDEHLQTRFMTEIEVLRSIDHPNIVKAYDFIELNSTIAYTMEFVKGNDLSRIVHTKRFAYAEVDSMMIQVLHALNELHQRNILHRDLKLENIILDEHDQVKLTDLGLIKHENNRGLTRNGILLGTAQYMPPEYIKNSRYETRSDIYSAGILLYELLTGRRWLNEENGEKAIALLIQNDFDMPVVLEKGCPEKYRFIIQTALKQNPNERFSSALKMIEAIQFDFSELELDVEEEPMVELTGTEVIHIQHSIPKRYHRKILKKLYHTFFSIFFLSCYLLLAIVMYRQIDTTTIKKLYRKAVSITSFL